MQEQIEYIENEMNEKYGYGAGENALEEYCKTNNINIITNHGNARDLMREIPVEEVKYYLKEKKKKRIEQIKPIIQKIKKTEKLNDDQVKQKLQKYLEDQNMTIFTRKNNIREKIAELEIEDLKRYIEE